ncbi:WD40 repeat domain-containing protein [Streptomyces sp. NPDC014006]|uniref:WD40 repeat domain-containing protein n=1 Tax=Streptomyces sp. NPDC014006 TaxID=3364870 RepID=UPI0036FA36D3
MNDPQQHDRHAEIHRQIATALAELVPDDPSIPPHPYLRRHLAEHAAHGQVLDDEHVPPALLPWESSLTVRRLLAATGDQGPGSRWLQAWALLEPYARNVDPLSRASSLRLAHHKAAPSREDSTGPDTFDQSPVTPVWSDGTTPDNVWLVNGTPMSALATVRGESGRRPLVMAGDERGLLHALHHDGNTAYAPLHVHDGKITQILALPGDRMVATGSNDGSVAIVDAVQGQMVMRAVPRRPGTWVSSLALYRPADHTAVLLAAFSDGYLASLHPAVFHTVDVELPTLDEDRCLLSALPAPDSRSEWLLFAQHDRVYCFNGRWSRPLSRHAGRVRSIVALPTAGHYAVADEQGYLSLWEATQGGRAKQTALQQRSSAITSLLVSEMGTEPALLSTKADGGVCLWALPHLDPIGMSLPGRASPVTALTSIAGRRQPLLVTAGADGTVRSWPLSRETFQTAPARWDRVTASALSPGQPPVLATARAARISLGDVYRASEPRTVLKGHVASALAWPRLHGRPHLAAALDDSRIVLTDPDDAQAGILAELHGHHLPATTMVPLADTDADRLASGSADGSVCVWDLRSTTLLAKFRDHRFSVRCLATHRNTRGLYLASGGSDGAVRVWNVRQLQQHGPTIKCGQFFVNDIAFGTSTGDDRRMLVASAGQNGTLKLWDALTADQVGQLSPGDGELTAVTALALPAGRRLFAAAGRTSIHVWDPAADRRLLQIVTGETITALKSVGDRQSTDASLLLATGEAGTSVFRLHHDRI